MPIPGFRLDGYLPDGVHSATIEEVELVFGVSSARRKRLMGRLKHWVNLGKAVNAHRVLIDGSFVTSKMVPGDVDAVIQVTQDFDNMFFQGLAPAVEIYEFVLDEGSELFAVTTDAQWDEWVGFFGSVRESERVSKGLIEVIL